MAVDCIPPPGEANTHHTCMRYLDALIGSTVKKNLAT